MANAILSGDEDAFRRAASPGGTCADLRNAFTWTTAKEWPCPIDPSDGPGNGWDILYVKLCGGALSDGTPGTVKDHGDETALLPPEITEYIAMMYVDWKLTS
jgi:hypothetical protein